jgi:hypothetical protein
MKQKMTPAPVPDLPVTLDLLRRHSQAASAGFGIPSTTEFHALWGHLETVRAAAKRAPGDCRSWLVEHESLIRHVEDCRKAAHDEAMRGPAR